jgi:Flp pilus assembly protein CpaB
VTRFLLVAIVMVAVIGIAATLGINVGRAPAAGGDFFAVPQAYPTSGGQELQPRWDASEEVAGEPSN